MNHIGCSLILLCHERRFEVDVDREGQNVKERPLQLTLTAGDDD